MNPITKLAILTIFSIFFTGCGSSNIDAKNADTLQDSFSNMIQDLSEKDRRKAGTGLLLMALHDSPEGISTSKISSSRRDAEYLIASIKESSDNTRILKVIGDLIIKSDGRLDGKSSQDLISFLDKSIAAATLSDKKSNEKLKLESIKKSDNIFSKLEEEKEKISESIASLNKLKDELEEKSNNLRTEGRSYLKSADFSKLKFNKFSHAFIGSIPVIVKNSLDKSIMQPEVGFDIFVKSDPSIKGAQGYATFDNTKIKSGEQRKFVFSNVILAAQSGNVKFDFPTTIDAYDIKPYMISAKLADGSKKLFTLQGDEWRYIRQKGYENSISKCDQQLDKLEIFKTKISQNIEKLKSGEIKTYPLPNRYNKFKCSGGLSKSLW